MDFNEIEIQKLFGHEAAEQENSERLKEYYLKSRIYDRVVTDLPLRILVGHKGIGKSALFKVAMEEEKTLSKRLTILIKPDDIVDIGEDADNFLKLIRDWKAGITEIIAKKALSSFGLQFDNNLRTKLNQFGGEVLKFIGSSLLNVFKDKVDIIPTQKIILENFLKTNKISIYIDDLDRGWEGRKKDIQRISALLNAIRDISSDNNGIFFRVSLRSDVYFLSRTSDESTDKTESSVIWYSWTNHEILVLLVKRIESYFGRSIDEKEFMRKNQSELMQFLKPIIELRFTGNGHWENAPMYRVLMSLVRKRPRDLVKLMTLAARQAQSSDSEIITTQNLEGVFEDYSQGRLQDTINEYRSELPSIERLILGMKPSKVQKKAAESYIYSTDKLIKKIRDIQSQGDFKWTSGKIADTKDLAGFLYKINFLTARKNTDTGIERKYFEENRYLSNKFVDFGYDWEVHPAYRWALQSGDSSNMYESLELSKI